MIKVAYADQSEDFYSSLDYLVTFHYSTYKHAAMTYLTVRDLHQTTFLFYCVL